MRKTFTLTVLSILISSSFLFAQTKLNEKLIKQEFRFCKVISYTFHRDKTIYMDYGNRAANYTVLNNAPVDTVLDKVNLLKNDILILDYLNNLGWDCFQIVSSYQENQLEEKLIYYFRKPKTE